MEQLWHRAAGGLNLSQRQSATTASTPTDQARVCLASPPPAWVTLWGLVVSHSMPRRPARDDDTGALGLGSLSPLGAVAALTCGGVAWEPWSHPGPVPAVPRGSPRDLARNWHGSLVEQPVRRLDLGTLEPQLMTVSHAGGCVDGSGARVPGHPTAAKKLGNGGIEYTLAATAAPSWGWTIRPRLRHSAKGCRLSCRQARSPRPIFPAEACVVSIESCLDEETRAVHRAGCAVP